MKSAFKWFTRGTEFIAAMTLAAIFVTFLIQVFTRYAAKIAWLVPIPPVSDWMSTLEPIGWTVNLISLLWVWVIFFGCAFFVRARDHVAFDILYQAAPERGRRVMAIAGGMIVIAAMLYSFIPTWDAFMVSRLMELKKIQTLRIPVTGDTIAIKWLFASYIVLMVAVIIRYVWGIVDVFRNGAPQDHKEQLLEEITSDGEDKA